MLPLRQRKISEGSGEAAVAIVKRMKRDEPEMRDACADQRVKLRILSAGGKPFKEVSQLRFEQVSRRSFKMHGRPVKATGNHLHGLVTA